MQADTLEGLAREIDVPEANLVETVRRFNELAKRGEDEDFGRGRESFDRAFTGGASPLVPIDTPPFRAAAFGTSDLGTKGGLRTDVDARVLGCRGPADPRPLRGGEHDGRGVRVRPTRAAATRSGHRCCSVTARHCTWRRSR